MMTTEQVYEMMGQGNLGYACVFKKEDHGKHTDFMFPMTPKNIANFIGQNAFTAEKIIMTDFCDRLICESIYGGFLMNCPDQNRCERSSLTLPPSRWAKKSQRNSPWQPERKWRRFGMRRKPPSWRLKYGCSKKGHHEN